MCYHTMRWKQTLTNLICKLAVMSVHVQINSRTALENFQFISKYGRAARRKPPSSQNLAEKSVSDYNNGL